MIMAAYDFQELCPQCHQPIPGQTTEWAGVTLDKTLLEVTHNGNVIHLGPREAAILQAVLLAEGQLASYAMIEDMVYGSVDLPLDFDIKNNVGVHTSNLRKKTGFAIHAVHGQGIIMARPD